MHVKDTLFTIMRMVPVIISRSRKQFISDAILLSDGIEDWNYYVSWTNSTPDQYSESWWFNYAGCTSINI